MSGASSGAQTPTHLPSESSSPTAGLVGMNDSGPLTPYATFKDQYGFSHDETAKRWKTENAALQVRIADLEKRLAADPDKSQLADLQQRVQDLEEIQETQNDIIKTLESADPIQNQETIEQLRQDLQNEMDKRVQLQKENEKLKAELEVAQLIGHVRRGSVQAEKAPLDKLSNDSRGSRDGLDGLGALALPDQSSAGRSSFKQKIPESASSSATSTMRAPSNAAEELRKLLTQMKAKQTPAV